jgi:hypothetical protein
MKKPKRLPFLFLCCTVLLLATSNAEAEGIEDNVLRNPAGVNELVVNITQYGVITSDGTPTKIAVNFSIPQDDERQDVQMDVKQARDELGTAVGVIEQGNPGNRFSYVVSGIVKSRANHLLSLPSSYTVPNEAKSYMQPTENIQSSDAAIRSLAEDIAKDSKDDFERIVKLAMWVHDHLNYDLSYTGKNLDALAVLEQRRGVCAEYTTLFIALARAIGIPAKFVSGYSYGERGWERHAYAEAYLGKWVPVDPLWLEIGYLDATHLKFGDHLDNSVKNNVEVTGFNVNSIEWLEDDVSLVSISYSAIEKADYDLAISSDEFRMSDEGIVTLSIIPSEFIVGRLVLEPCSGDYKVLDVYEKEKKVILRPGVKEQVYWKIKINPGLPSNLLFTCPLTLNSRSLALKTIDASVNTRYGQRTSSKLSARLSASVVELGGEQKVYIALSNLLEQVKLGVVAGDLKEEWDAEGDFQTIFSFKPKDVGENEVVVYTSGGETVTLTYTVTSHLNIAIENFTAPTYMKAGEIRNISAYVVNKGVAEESVRLNMNVDGVDNFANFMLKNKYAVSLPVSFAVSGLKAIRLEIAAPGLNLSETRMVEVYEEPVIYYETDYAEGKGILKLDVKKSKIKNVTIKISGSEASADEIFGEKKLAFAIAPGEYTMEISCSDIAGNPRQMTETLVFHEKNFLEIILAALNDIAKAISSLFAPS